MKFSIAVVAHPVKNSIQNQNFNLGLTSTDSQIALRNSSLIKKSTASRAEHYTTNGLKNLIGLSTSISLSMRNQKNVLCPGEIIRESMATKQSLRDRMKNGVYFSIALTQHREVFNLRPVGTGKPLRYRF